MFRPGSSETRHRSCDGAEGFRGRCSSARDLALCRPRLDWWWGVFDAGKSGFDSEIWADGEQLMQAFRRQSYSSVVFRLADAQAFESTREAIDGDPRLTLEAKRELRFYAEQSEALATFIGILGTSLAVIFSIGATVGAMITMFGSVASRVGEIGTLRALGFRRGAVLGAFLAEALLLSLVGGAFGLLAASGMQAVDVSTTNFATFSELAFQFTLTAAIAAQAMLFALAMGVVGGFIPAWRAARLRIVDCLRAA